MKKINILLFGVLFFIGCQDQYNLNFFDDEKSYIEFGEPTIFKGTQQLFLDSLSFSFSEQEIELEDVELVLPIHLIGQQKNYDREYKVVIDENATSLNPNLFRLSDPIIRAGRFSDTLFVHLIRDDELDKGIFELTMYLEENPSFGKGNPEKTRYSIFITSQLSEPLWWTTWRSYFGPYRPEVYQQWIRIYRSGLDTSPPVFIGEKPNYSWRNMPMYAYKEYTPVTFMYLEKLKKYFEDNEVYPNGDNTKRRIYLP